MTVTKIVFHTLISIFLLKSAIFGQVNRNGDFQYWYYLSVEKTLIDAWSSRLIGVMRWGDDASQLYFTYGQWQMVYTKKCFEIAPGYRQEYFKPLRDWSTRYNPLIDISLFFPGKWRWEDRNRIVYHIPEDSDSAWIYRNRLRLISPQIMPLFKLKLFVDDEVFFHEGFGFVQNRLSIGLVGDPTSWLTGRIYYMYRNLRVGEIWTYQNVLAFHMYF